MSHSVSRSDWQVSVITDGDQTEITQLPHRYLQPVSSCCPSEVFFFQKSTCFPFFLAISVFWHEHVTHRTHEKKKKKIIFCNMLFDSFTADRLRHSLRFIFVLVIDHGLMARRSSLPPHSWNVPDSDFSRDLSLEGFACSPRVFPQHSNFLPTSKNPTWKADLFAWVLLASLCYLHDRPASRAGLVEQVPERVCSTFTFALDFTSVAQVVVTRCNFIFITYSESHQFLRSTDALSASKSIVTLFKVCRAYS